MCQHKTHELVAATGSRNSTRAICDKDPLALPLAFQCKLSFGTLPVVERRRWPVLMNDDEDHDLCVDPWKTIWPLRTL